MMFVRPFELLRHSDAVNKIPPLGLLYIASYLINRTNHEVAVLDAQTEELTYEEIEDQISTFRPDVVGITAYTLNLLDTLEIARRAKKVNPDVFVVVGGPHAFIYPKETAGLEAVDFVISGEGEEAMAELVNALEAGTSLENIRGLHFKKNGEVYSTPTRDVISDLDALPFPARSLLQIEKYRFVTAHGVPATTMITSRGCLARCSFCNVPYHFVRERSPRNIIAEMLECQEMGIGEIKFYDDSFNYSESRTIKLAQEIINSGVKMKYSITARVDKVSPKMLELLRESGCIRIGYGIEAGDDKSLKTLRKGATVEMARRAVKMTKDAGIEVLAFFIIGIPGQTRDDVKKTIDFAIELDPDFVIITPLVLFPATELYEKALKAGAFPDFYHEFAQAPCPTEQLAYWSNPLSFEEVQKLMKLAYRKFVFRPRYIWKQAKKIATFEDFTGKIRAALETTAYSFLPKHTYRPIQTRTDKK
jgi:radical SAM superfamily enzyme YgiQ (UPF0313 family)